MTKAETTLSDTELFRKGLEARSSVLGADVVRRIMEHADSFDAPMQHLATEFCWGAIWTRPGLDRKTRSLLNIAMLAALNRSKELETHIRGAFVNGATPLEVQEVLLQTAVYAGVPAGMEAFRVATPVVNEYLARPAPAERS